MASSDGRPQLSAAWISLLCQQRSGDDNGGNPPTEVLDNFLFLGDLENASSLSQLQHFDISCVLSVVTARELGNHPGMERLFLNIRDSDKENIAMLFEPACEFIQRAKAAGKRILVHCMAGRSRSATLVIAFLMRSSNMTLHDAFVFVKQKRPIVYPNIGFWLQLMEEELKLFGTNSPTPSNYVQALAIHGGHLEISPSKLFNQYMVAAALEQSSYALEQKKRTLDEWPCGWPATKSIEDLFMASIEHVRCDARTTAVEFIGELLSRKHFTSAEVLEGFALLQSLDLDDLRLDVPKIDEYIAQMIEEAGAHGLLGSSGS